MLALTGWAIAAFWAVRFLFGNVGWPWAAAVAFGAGWLVRERGPVLWMAAGMALGERVGVWDLRAAMGLALFAWGVHRSQAGVLALGLGVVAPQLLLRLAAGRYRPGWEGAAMMGAAGLAVILVVAWRRHWWMAPAWKVWPGFAASAVLMAGGLGVAQWRETQRLESRRAALAAVPRPDPAAPYVFDYFHKGVSFTAERVPYDAEEARQMLGRLPAYGVDAVALVPYAFVPRGEVGIRIPGREESWESEAGMEILAGEARRRGMRVMVKPHVWRLQGRTGIPETEAREWLRQYRPLVEHYARFAARIHADTLCIGTELRGLTGYEREWRELIAAGRTLYKGPMVYAANHGEEFETIRFWDALDYIGVDNYYPLDDNYSAAELVAKIEAVQQRFGKPVLFTEAGFGAHEDSHLAPWEDRTQKRLDLGEQARSYEALLSAVYRKEWFRGVYWWKVGTNGYGGPDDNSMTPWGKPAMDVVRRFYLLPAR
jgi:hypothetical protein